MKRQQIYDRINSIILDKLKSGLVPWSNPINSFLPTNFISKRFYQGMNWLLLNHLNYASPYYLTFLQTKNKGGNVLKGSEGQPVIFWKILEGRTPEEDKHPYMKTTTVFNLTQTTLYNPEEENNIKLKTGEDLLSDIIIIHNPVIETNSRGKAYYIPSTHSITVPAITHFNNSGSYYKTLFHELIHWTGKKLKREDSTDKKSQEYAKEELIAELGASYLCSLCGINSEIDQSVTYIDGWMKAIKDDDSLIIKSSTEAKKAVNFLITKSVEDENE